MADRASRYSLPADFVITQLPREFLFGVGLQAVLPALLISLMYFVLRTIAGSGLSQLYAIALSAYAVDLIAVILVTWWGIKSERIVPADLAAQKAAIVGLAALTLVGVILLGVPITRHLHGNVEIGVSALMAGIAALPLLIFVLGLVQLYGVEVCTKDGKDSGVHGTLLGTVGDRMYLGESTQAIQYVVAVPVSDYGSIAVSNSPTLTPCNRLYPPST